MAKKIRIKDIADVAGVSAGTVDRVLHNRGHVTEAKRIKIEEALKKMNYTPNIHISAISLRRKYNIVIAIPKSLPGEYWSFVEEGIDRALKNYSAVDIHCEFCYYNHFDLFSCRKTFEQVYQMNPDAVIIGPTFRDETVYLAEHLADRNIPYVFIDSTMDGVTPLAYFTADPQVCGRLMAKLITQITPDDSDIALLRALRVGDESANTTILRKAGFMDYYNENKLNRRLINLAYSAQDNEMNEKLLKDFFITNKNVRGAVIFNSRGHVIADYMKKHKIHDVKFVGIDLTEKNSKLLSEGYIDFLIGQRPEQQAYMAVETLVQYLVFGKEINSGSNYMPLDIFVKENAALYNNYKNRLVY